MFKLISRWFAANKVAREERKRLRAEFEAKRKAKLDLIENFENRIYKQLFLHCTKGEMAATLSEMEASTELFPEDRSAIKKAAMKKLLADYTSDAKLTSTEHKLLNFAATVLGIHPVEAGLIEQGYLSKIRFRGAIADGQLVRVSIPSGLPIIFKDGETLVYAASARLMKRKKTTTRIGYSGVSASIKIAKGIRYRVGSYTPRVHVTEHLVEEDAGLLWISTQRIGFKGYGKNISFPAGKLAALEINDEGLLELSKDGREKPYMLDLNAEMDTVCSIISLVVNEDYQLIDSNVAS